LKINNKLNTMKKIILLLSTILLFVSITQGQSKVYQNPKFAHQPFHGINHIAILPFITPVPENNLSAGQLNQIRFNMGTEFQNDLFAYQTNIPYLNDKMQNTRVTNAKLLKNHILIDSLANYTPAEICKLLNTDAIIAGSISHQTARRRKDNIIHFTLSFYNNDNILIWQYNITESKSTRKSLDDMVRKVLKKAMQKFPKENVTSEKKESKIMNLFKRKK